MWLTDLLRYILKNIVRKSHDIISMHYLFYLFAFFFQTRRTSVKKSSSSGNEASILWAFAVCEATCPFGNGGLYHGKAQVKQNIASFLGEALIFLEGEKNGERRNFLSPKSWACGAPGSENTTVMFQWVFHSPTPFPLQKIWNYKILWRGLGGAGRQGL